MCNRILCLMLCVMMIFSFSAISFAEDDRIPEAGDHIFFGHYEQDNDLNNGPEPIEWRILEVKGTQMLLLSEYILDAIPFNFDVDGNQWSSSSLRKWLNKDFIENGFSSDESSTILLTAIDNSSKQSCYFTSATPDTEDTVFLLSYAEVKEYFESPPKTACIATNFAKPKITIRTDKGSWSTVNFMDYEYSPWWFRTPAGSWHSISCGKYIFGNWHYDNVWLNNGLHCFQADCQSNCGVRPAMWVDINKYLDLLPAPEPDVTPVELTAITCDESIVADTVLGDTAWKLSLPEGFVADELTEADLADHYIGYYLRDDDIIAVQHSDNSASLVEWQKELIDRGFSIEGLYNLNGYEAILYRDEDADTMTASVLDGKGKLLEVTFYPYSTISEEADTVISSIQQEASKKRLSGASGNNKTGAGTGETVSSPSASPEEAYQEMVTAYKAGNYSDSYSYYEQAKGYQDADKYGNLLKARLCYTLKLTDSEIEELEKAIVNDISFADSKDVLVCNSAIAHYYLLGTWYSTNGTYIYEVKDNGGTTTTVPVVPRTGNYYEILNGTYWRYFDDKWDERTAVFDFKPISKSKMEIYSYQVKQSYTFNKTR